MIQISVWNENNIDTSSNETKEKVSNAVKEYILEHWNECIKINKNIQNNIYYYDFKIGESETLDLLTNSLFQRLFLHIF